MCGRYVSPEMRAIEAEYRVLPLFDYRRSYNVCPTQSVPVITQTDGAREARLIRWGLIPFFAKGTPPKYSTINARLETVETAPSYRTPWKRGQRCIVAASGFYEWHLDGDGRKTPYYITAVDQQIVGLAGLWDRSVSQDGTAIESCVIITMPANALMRDIHNVGAHPGRMPALLRREDHDAWLAGSHEDARDALRPYDAALMLAHEVSTRVNSPRNNGPELIQPVS